MHNAVKFSVKADFCILLSLSMFVIPLQWLIGWLIAAAIHETFHILAIGLFRIKILSITLRASGAVIESESMTPFCECICALAGPVGGLAALLLLRVSPEIALCAMLQSLYNLLPVYPLDGGRALKNLIACIWGEQISSRLSKTITGIIVVFLSCIGGYISLFYSPVALMPTVLLVIVFCKNSLQYRENDSTIIRDEIERKLHR